MAFIVVSLLLYYFVIIVVTYKTKTIINKQSNMSNKKAEQLHKEFSEQSQQARQQKQYNTLLNNLSSADQETVKLLANIDDMSGGRLTQLVHTYMAIKINSK